MAPIVEELFEASLCSDGTTWTKDTLSGLPACKGVLLFTDGAGHPIQLIQAASLRRTAQAKLLEGEPSDSPTRKTDISDLTAGIYYTCCYNNFQSHITYTRLAHAIFRDKSSDWLQLPKPVFAAIDTETALPYFRISTNPKPDKKRHVFGLFPNRKSAGVFCDSLNTVFSLCRNRSLLGSGNESSCPYLQMGSCPGPCVGTLSMTTYHGFVEEAINAANGNLDDLLAERTARMQAAAAAMNYERAKLLKDQIDALSKLKGRDFDWTENMEHFSVLHIDTAGKIKVEGQRKHVQYYTAWKASAENMICLGDFDLRQPEAVESLFDMYQKTKTPVFYANSQYEHLSTLSLFLFRSHRQGLWLNVTKGLPDTQTLQQTLLEILGIERPDNLKKQESEPKD